MNARCGTILLVEDNADDVDLTLIAFERAGLSAQVVVARDGVEALDYLFGTGAHAGRDVREQPRVVLLDLNLPRVSGHEVLQRMRADPRTREVPVVVLTSSLEERDLRESYRHFANSYVRKPVNFDEFIEVTKQLGVYWTTLNRAMAQGEVV
ncbi:response regulator [Corallococcus exercitus]|uniref:Response regulator n=1 Tax=Corallococcus exercitus TaxID=2316736 RepID=A0A7Y4KI85_9BACT|nr:response regulator [Corallococcus exercitus]NOK34122.1 response regulator [Corallococcus exercitus]